MPKILQPYSVSSSGGAYTAGAVHFDGSTYLQRGATLTGVAAAAGGSGSFWVKVAAVADLAAPAGICINTVGNAAFAPVLMTLQSVDSVHIQFFGSVFNQSAASGVREFDFETTATDFPGAATWVNILWSTKTDLSAGSKIAQVYFNDVGSTVIIDYDADASFNTDWGGADVTDVSIPDFNPGQRYTGDMADFQYRPGTYIDFSISSNRRNFITAGGAPVDPATAAAAHGTAAVLFQGGSSTFATNAGTGGTFTLTGSLTDAATHP